MLVKLNAELWLNLRKPQVGPRSVWRPFPNGRMLVRLNAELWLNLRKPQVGLRSVWRPFPNGRMLVRLNAELWLNLRKPQVGLRSVWRPFPNGRMLVRLNAELWLNLRKPQVGPRSVWRPFFHASGHARFARSDPKQPQCPEAPRHALMSGTPDCGFGDPTHRRIAAEELNPFAAGPLRMLRLWNPKPRGTGLGLWPQRVECAGPEASKSYQAPSETRPPRA